MRVPVVTEIQDANDQVARENRMTFDLEGVRVVHVMGSPGAGKTAAILATIARTPELRWGVVEGDVASTIDADRVAEEGIPVVQVNTRGRCHLDAPMVHAALPHLPLADLDALCIENVGSLVCPASHRLGAHVALVIGSVPEGDDKPYKYPGLFAKADVVLLNKADLIDVFAFDVDAFVRGVRTVNRDAPIFVVSCRSGEGLEAWVAWLCERAALAPA